LVQQLEESVRHNDTGTLIYQWYVSRDTQSALVHEHYESCDAFIRHAANAAPLLTRLPEVAEFGKMTFSGGWSDSVLGMVLEAARSHPRMEVEFYR
jgi:hypothetical protein